MKQIGRPRALSDKEITEVVRWVSDGGKNLDEKCAELGISRQTLRRYLKRWQEGGAPSREEVNP